METETQIERYFDALFKNIRSFTKAGLVTAMMMFAIITFTGAPSKALLVAAFILPISVFNTWRRLLEPISLWVFLMSAVYLCDRDILIHLKGALNFLTTPQ